MNTLQQNIKQDYFSAMKSGDKETKAVLSMVLARVEAVSKERGQTLLEDEVVLKAIQAEVKQVNQSIEGAEKANRPDQQDKYMRDLAILEDYLPAQVEDEELEAVIKSVLIDMGDQNFGDILREVSQRLSGGADNKRISQALIKKLK